MSFCPEKFLRGGIGFPACADNRGGQEARATDFSCFAGEPTAHEELLRKVYAGWAPPPQYLAGNARPTFTISSQPYLGPVGGASSPSNTGRMPVLPVITVTTKVPPVAQARCLCSRKDTFIPKQEKKQKAHRDITLWAQAVSTAFRFRRRTSRQSGRCG